LSSAERADLRRTIDGVGGWLSEEEAETLYALAKGCTGRGSIVEIGSNRGRSTICLALGSKAGHHVPIHAIDPRTGRLLEEYHQNLERTGADDIVTSHNMRSDEAADVIPAGQPVELLFIDGSHKEEMVRLDWEIWASRVVDGGWIAMHDTTNFPGSKRVAEEKIYRSGRFRDVTFVYPTLTVGRKAAARGAGDRLRNGYSLAVKRTFELFIGVRRHVPAPAKRAGRAVLRRIR
jgi:predicted O-methyltransferase YrrM